MINLTWEDIPRYLHSPGLFDEAKNIVTCAKFHAFENYVPTGFFNIFGEFADVLVHGVQSCVVPFSVEV